MKATSVPKPLRSILLIAVLLLAAACGSDSDSEEGTDGSTTVADTEAGTSESDGADPEPGEIQEIVIGASPTPHAEILEFVDTELAEAAGIDLEIVTYDDYVLPNEALAEGELDANYFQHLPYFESQVAEKGFDFDHYEGVHIEPYGIYGNEITSLDDLAEGSKVGVTNDPSNQARALDLLVANELITLEDTGDEAATLLDVADNPLGLEFIETAPEQLVRSLEDLDIAVINGNFALEADLDPATESLALEDGEDNPYANFVAVQSADVADPGLVALDELLRSDEVRSFIEERWPAGEVIAAF